MRRLCGCWNLAVLFEIWQCCYDCVGSCRLAAQRSLGCPTAATGATANAGNCSCSWWTVAASDSGRVSSNITVDAAMRNGFAPGVDVWRLDSLSLWWEPDQRCLFRFNRWVCWFWMRSTTAPTSRTAPCLVITPAILLSIGWQPLRPGCCLVAPLHHSKAGFTVDLTAL